MFLINYFKKILDCVVPFRTDPPSANFPLQILYISKCHFTLPAFFSLFQPNSAYSSLIHLFQHTPTYSSLIQPGTSPLRVLNFFFNELLARETFYSELPGQYTY